MEKKILYLLRVEFQLESLKNLIAKGTDKESQLLALLICGSGRDIVCKYSASQIIKNEAILPKNPTKKDALEKLKVS